MIYNNLIATLSWPNVRAQQVRAQQVRSQHSLKIKKRISEWIFALPFTFIGCISPFTTHVTGLHYENEYQPYYILQSKYTLSLTLLTHMNMQSWRQRSRQILPQRSPRLCCLPPQLGMPGWAWQLLPWKTSYPGFPAEVGLSDQAIYNIDKSIKQYHLEFKSSKCTENKHGLCNWSCKLHPIYEDLWDVIIMHPLMQVCIKGNGVLHAEHLSCWDSRSSNDKLTLGYNLQTVHLVH